MFKIILKGQNKKSYWYNEIDLQKLVAFNRLLCKPLIPAKPLFIH